MLLFVATAIAIPLGLDLYLPVPESNPLNRQKIELGRRLFFDRRLSRDSSIACVSCHDPEPGFSDDHAIAIGVFGRLGRRNAPALINRGYGKLFFWDGGSPASKSTSSSPSKTPMRWISVYPKLVPG
jgi:cytochrome c peroxidase